MNRPPSILVDTGFEVDQNGALTEIVMPKVVNTCNAPRKVTFEGQTLNWIPSTAAALQEFVAPNCTTAPSNCFSGHTKLTSVSMPNITSFVNSANNGTFKGCTHLESVTLTSLISLSAVGEYGNSGGDFLGCTALTSVILPSLATDTGKATNSGTAGSFKDCTALTTVSLPVLTQTTSNGSTAGTFFNCTALQTVQLGSTGHAVISLATYTFKNCTQPNLTITIYTNGGASLSGEPWGATNADIEYEEA